MMIVTILGMKIIKINDSKRNLLNFLYEKNSNNYHSSARDMNAWQCLSHFSMLPTFIRDKKLSYLVMITLQGISRRLKTE
jgi:hypothetical protein